METCDDINLWEYFQILYFKKNLLLSLVIVSVVSSYFITNFFIEKQYQSEIWININDDFPGNKGEDSIDRFKAYMLYPEIIQATFKNKNVIRSSLENNISQKNVGELTQILYSHPANSNAPELLNRWMQMTKFRIALDTSMQLESYLESDVMLIQSTLDFKKKKILSMRSLLSKITKFNEVEVIPKETIDPKVYIFKEINHNYVTLEGELNNLEIEIEQLKNQELFLKELLIEYQNLLSQIKNLLSSEELDDEFIDEQLKYFEKRYNVYLQNIKNNKKNISLIPFTIISKSTLNLDPIGPNVMLNILLSGFLGLFIGVVLILFSEYVKKMKSDETSIIS